MSEANVRHAGAATSNLGGIVAALFNRLMNVEPGARETEAAHLMAVLDRGGRGSPQAGVSLRISEATAMEPALTTWAARTACPDDGEHLAVDVTAGPIPIPRTLAATGRSLVSNGRLGADIIHLPAGSGFAPHTHPGDHLLFVLAGKGTIATAGNIQQTESGQVYMIEGAVAHAVGAITDHVVLAIGAPHRPLDSPDRQTLTAYAAILTSLGTLTCRICGVTGDAEQELAAVGCTHAPHTFE